MRRGKRTQLTRLIEVMEQVRDSELTPLDAAVKYLLRIEGERIYKVRPQYLRHQIIEMKKLSMSPEEIADVLDIPEHMVFRLQR